MDHKKCSNCGFINFITAEVCRKCETNLNGVNRPYQVEPPTSGSGFPVFKVLVCSFVGLSLLGGLIFLSALAGGVSRMAEPTRHKIGWQEFRSADGGSVMMPSQTKTQEAIITSTPIGNVTAKVHTSALMGQGSVLFCVYTLPATRSAANPSGIQHEQLPGILDDQLNAVVTNTNSTLVSKKSVILGSNPALEFELRPPGNSNVKAARGFGKLFFVGGHEVLLLITASEGSDLLAEKEVFLNPPQSQ